MESLIAGRHNGPDIAGPDVIWSVNLAERRRTNWTGFDDRLLGPGLWLTGGLFGLAGLVISSCSPGNR